MHFIRKEETQVAKRDAPFYFLLTKDAPFSSKDARSTYSQYQRCATGTIALTKYIGTVEYLYDRDSVERHVPAKQANRAMQFAEAGAGAGAIL